MYFLVLGQTRHFWIPSLAIAAVLLLALLGILSILNLWQEHKEVVMGVCAFLGWKLFALKSDSLPDPEEPEMAWEQRQNRIFAQEGVAE